MNAAITLPPLIEDLSLSYRLRPADGPAQGLVVLLHGVGSNEMSLAGLAALLPASLAVALVRSPIALGPSAFCAFQVSFTANGPMIDAEAAEVSRAKLALFVADLQARLGVAAVRSVVAGFSQGGIMSASLALTHPDSVAGFGILSGRILPEIAPQLGPAAELARLQALVTHGRLDNTLPVAWAERSDQWLGELGVQLESHRYSAGHEITPDMARDFVDWVARVLPAV
jgi:phospholipase/carboxylesterase